MKFTKILGAVAIAVMALMVSAGTAAATTLETGGVAENAAITIKISLASGNSSLLSDTFGVAANTCTTSITEGTTTKFTGTAVEGPLSTLSWSNCTDGNPTVDAKGSISVTNISGTTNGTVSSTGTKVTWPSFFGNLTCETSNTDLGKINGVKSGTASMTVNAILACTVIGTAKLTGTYVITGPSNLGVGA